MRLIILGPPGTGKGSEAKLIAEKYNIDHLSTGDLLRKEVAEKTPLGQKVEKIMTGGGLVSDYIILDIIKSRLTLKFILDGFPRTLEQAKSLDKLAKIDRVLYLESSKDLIVERLLKRAKTQGRSDDNRETIEKRFKEYEEKTKPLLAYYKNKLIHINGDQTIPEVAKEIFEKLENEKI